MSKVQLHFLPQGKMLLILECIRHLTLVLADMDLLLFFVLHQFYIWCYQPVANLNPGVFVYFFKREEISGQE